MKAMVTGRTPSEHHAVEFDVTVMYLSAGLTQHPAVLHLLNNPNLTEDDRFHCSVILGERSRIRLRG
jgi:hypothetical protein